RARMELMTTGADGRVRMEFIIPTRGLVGYRGQLLTESRGTALLHQIGAGYVPWAGAVAHPTSGGLGSCRKGEANAYALFNREERSGLLNGSGGVVDEGRVV